MKMYKKPYSSRKIRGYTNYINEEPENDIDYKKYFEKVLSKEKSTDKYNRQKKYKYDWESQEKKWTKFPKNGNNYQVFAYQDTDEHRGVFRTKKTVHTLSTSENEVRKNREYPLLAFKDNNIERRGSDTVYLPVIVLDKKYHKSRVETIPKQTFTSAHLGNVQVFAANLHDQQNIFQRLGEVSNKKPEIVTYHENLSGKTAPDTGQTTPGLKNANNSMLGSTVKHEEYNQKQNLENMSYEVKTNQTDSFNMNNNKLIYDVNTEVPKHKIRKSKQEEPINTNNLTEYKNIEKSTQDDYPVTKNYIKINNNDLEHQNSIRSKSEKNYKIKRNSTMEPIGNHTGIQEINKEISQRIQNNGVIQKKSSVIKKNYSQMSDKNNFVQKYGSQNKSLEEKQGSFEIINYLQKNKEMSMKDLPEVKTLSTINKKSINEQEEQIKKLPKVLLSRELNAEKRSGIEYKTEAAIPQEVEDIRTSAATVRKSYLLERKSQNNLLREDHKLQKSRTSPLKPMPIQKKLTLTSQDRQLDQENFTHQLGKVSITTIENIATAVKDRNKTPPNVKDQFSREELLIDIDQHEQPKDKISTQRSRDIARKVLSKVATKDSFNVGNIQRSNTQRDKSFLKQHSARQTMAEITQGESGELISTGIIPVSEKHIKQSGLISDKSILKINNNEIPYKESKFENPGLIEESGYFNDKNIYSVIDVPIKKPVKSNTKSASSKRSKSKLSLKKIASSLLNLGRKKSSTLKLDGSTETYISKGTRTLSKSKSTDKLQKNSDSLLINSQILDTNDYESQKEKPSKSRISMRTEKTEPKSLSTKLTHSKSMSILPTATKSILKMFSRRKPKDKPEKAKTKSQTKIHDSGTEKSKKERWKWFKSKSDIKKDSVPILTSKYEKPPLSIPIEDKKSEIKAEGIRQPSEPYIEKEEEKIEILREKDEPCKCFAEYIKIGRECGHFFLGITLHKQVMRFIDLF